MNEFNKSWKLMLSLLLIVIPFSSRAQTTTDSTLPPSTGLSVSSSATKQTKLPPIIVSATAVAPSNPSRIQTDLSDGTSTYTMTQEQINTIAQGANTSFNQVLVRVPGVSDDTYGAIHFRNEDPYYRY